MSYKIKNKHRENFDSVHICPLVPVTVPASLTFVRVFILECLLECLFFQAPTPQQREMMEEAAARIAQDNCELACCFIQKTAVEKAGPEMDKRLATVRFFRKLPQQQ